MGAVIADYIQERDAFHALLEGDAAKRILTILGESGTGKTSLLNACMEEVPGAVQHVHLNCRGSAVSVSEVFSRTGFRFTWDLFPHFIEQVAELSGSTHVSIDGNWLAGINNKINVALKAESPVDRDERRVTLTDAWFEDVRGIDKLFLISVDTFEQAGLETSEWFSGSFLFRAAYTENLRVLIAGQRVPEFHEHVNEWGRCCSAFHLAGVKEAKFWMPVIEALGYIVPAVNPLDFMAGICHGLNGRPADIMKVIEGFPRQRSQDE